MVLISKMGVKSSPMYLVLCYGTITKAKLTVGKVGYNIFICLNQKIFTFYILTCNIDFTSRSSHITSQK
jgi:hypothetical protein